MAGCWNGKLWSLVLVLCCIFLVSVSGPVAAQFVPKPAEPKSETTIETPALESLLNVLKDDAARAELIADLESSLAKLAPEETAAIVEEETMSMGRRIALITQEVGENAVAAMTRIWASFQSGGSVFSGLNGDEFSILVAALPGLLVVIAITVLTFLALRKLAKRFYARLGRRAEGASAIQSMGLFVGSNLTDAFIVIVAWALGYIATILAVGEFGQIGIRQSMYLNAFLLVEMAKVVVRAILSPIASGLRLVPVSDHAARAITRYLSFVISVLGYGQLLVVPIVNQSASMAAGNGVSALLSVIVLLYMVYVVLRRRVEVADWLYTGAQTPEMPDLDAEEIEADADAMMATGPSRPGWFLRTAHGLARGWYWVALVYLGAMFAIVMSQPAEVTLAAITGSAKILGAVMVATLISGWLATSVGRGIALPEDINAKLPLLERRINRFVPRAFGFLRIVLMIGVLLFSLDVMGITDMHGWMESQIGLSVTATVLSVLAILFVTFLLWIALTSFVDYKLNPEYGGVPTAREITLLTLMRNAVTIALVILTLMFCLSEIGLDIGPLLASAGVLGLAIGFGAQKMVQDIITGVFIQFENAINVGDVITVGGITGGVERLSVRSVSLRDAHGVFHIIPFSSVDMVSNFMKEFSYFVCDMGVAYRENVEDCKEAMHEAFDKLMQDPEIAREVLAPLEWFGVQEFADSAVILRARIKTVPGKQWATGRAYNGVLKEVFDARGIEIPFPQQTIWFGEAKDGTTQPIQLANPKAKA